VLGIVREIHERSHRKLEGILLSRGIYQHSLFDWDIYSDEVPLLGISMVVLFYVRHI
jgi:hypothetical protein